MLQNQSIMQENTSKLTPKLQLNNSYYRFRKYNILKLINSLPADMCLLYKKHMPNALGANRQTFANWLNASITDTLEIPSVKLAQIASFFQVPIEELFNVPIPPVIIKTEDEIMEETFLTQTGLTR